MFNLEELFLIEYSSVNNWLKSVPSSELRFQMYAMHTSLVLKCEFGD